VVVVNFGQSYLTMKLGIFLETPCSKKVGRNALVATAECCVVCPEFNERCGDVARHLQRRVVSVSSCCTLLSC